MRKLRPPRGLEVPHLEGAVHDEEGRVRHLVLPGRHGGVLLRVREGVGEGVDARLGLLGGLGVQLVLLFGLCVGG